MFGKRLKRTLARLFGWNAWLAPGPMPRLAAREGLLQRATPPSFVVDQRPHPTEHACFVGGPMDGYEAEVGQELVGPDAQLIAVPISLDLVAQLSGSDSCREAAVTSVAVYRRSYRWGASRFDFVKSMKKEAVQ